MIAAPEFGRGAHWDGWRVIYRPPGAVPLIQGGSLSSPRVAPSSLSLAPMFNISTRKVGGLRFIKVGRLCLSFCITQTYRSL